MIPLDQLETRNESDSWQENILTTLNIRSRKSAMKDFVSPDSMDHYVIIFVRCLIKREQISRYSR